MANWDTALGYQLYCEGKTDGEIADECKVKTSTVTSYRLKRWRKGPDGGRGAPPAAEEKPLKDERKEAAEMPIEKDNKPDTARMMEVIAKMTEGMGGIKAVCVGNIVQALWNLSCVDDIREARNILDWLEENYDFG